MGKASEGRGAAEADRGVVDLAGMLLDEYERLHGPDAAIQEIRSRPVGDPARLAETFRLLHGRERWALCLSGGGIRSATFGLGILQGLARAGLLSRFDYLSTVSGGGYVGGWLTGWIQRHQQGLEGVVKGLLQSLADRTEPGPIRHLRDYSNYLSPKLGALSADTWTLVATYLRNLLLHWLVLLPSILVVLLTPKIGLQLVLARNPGWPAVVAGLIVLLVAAADLVLHWHPGTEGRPRPWLRIGVLAALSIPFFAYGLPWLRPDAAPGWWSGFATRLSLADLAWLAVLLAGALLFWTTIYLGLGRPSSGRLSHGQVRFLLLFLAPIMLSSLLLTLAWAWLAGSGVSWWWLIPVGFGLRVFGVLVAHWERRRAANSETDALRTTTIRPRDRIAEILAAAATGALGGAMLWVISGWFDPDGGPIAAMLFACLVPPLIIGTFLVAETIFVGLASFWTEDEDREWWGRSAAWLLIGGLMWMLLRILVLLGPAALAGLGALWGTAAAAGGGVAGVLAAFLGFIDKAADLTEAAGKTRRRWTLGDLALGVLAPTFLVVLLALLSLGLDHALSFGIVDTAKDGQIAVSAGIPMERLLLAAGGLAAIGLLMSWCVNINKFSLHAMYRYRLIRAYLGASNLHRKPHPFTGFDPADNIQMTDIWPNPSAVDLAAPAPTERARTGGKRQPLHVINIALNLVSGKRLAWQQRKAAPFTVSALHCGSRELGYRALFTDDAKGGYLPDRVYGGQKEGISLGTAVTISGAAASPNMGYHSSGVVTFIMALFNARLGWWLGNPGPRGEDSFHKSGPEYAIGPLVAETFGLTNDENPYVYLSDGGHFENLGLYEMVLRRCRLIVVSDAGCDPAYAFQDLGNAIRKARVDLGISIEMDGMPMRPRGVGTLFSDRDRPGGYCAVGRIVYPAAENAPDGVLIYLKPGLYGDEPVDVRNYASQNDAFPHEPTSDQWFSEAQFESYRALGAHVMEKLFGREPVPATIAEVEQRARRYAYGERRA